MIQPVDPRWESVATAEASDALDKLGVVGQAFGIASLIANTRLTGRAFTVSYSAVGVPAGTVGDYLDEVPVGAVVVLDNRGRDDCTVWGGILTQLAARKGIAGTVVDGVARDTATADELSYPLFARGRYMRTGKDRVQADAVGVTVQLGEARVEPGDLVLGDADGVIVIPATHERETLEIVLSVRAGEDAVLKRVRAGATLAEARSAAGYHQLQRKRS